MPPTKRNKDDLIGSDEVATDYKLQQFLEDVQKFTDRSKKNNEKPKRSRKPDDGEQACHKKGLFENGFKSRTYLIENEARLKSNLNDLVKECPNIVGNEEETLPSNSESTMEGSSELGNQEIDSSSNDNNNNNNVAPIENEKAADESERLHFSETPHETPEELMTIIKDKNHLRELLWEKYCERMRHCAQSIGRIFPPVDHMKIAQQRINAMIYRTFLQHARKHPTILRRIFSSDEIKKLAQVVVNENADKCVQTDDVTVSDSVSNDIHCEMSTKTDFILSFPHSSQNRDNEKEGGNFFDLNQQQKIDTRVNFLESLENQPDIYSPGVQNATPDCNVTPPPSPLPAHIRACWAPSTLSTPPKPEIFSPDISELQPSFQEPSISPPEPIVENQPYMMKNRRRKMSPEPQFVENINTLDSPQLLFPKRKQLAYSPHRL